MRLSQVFLFTVILSTAECKIWEIPLPDPVRQCYNRVNSTPVDTYVGSLYCWHCEHALANFTNPNEIKEVTSETLEYIDEIYKEDVNRDNTERRSSNRGKRQALSPCVRKEYRMLTLDERRRYHNAVNAIRRDTSISPNVFSAIARLHTGRNNLIAHGGAGFLGWHRIFLAIYESALRRYDSSVCLPYWDSTLDSKLPNPFLSSIWSPDFLGTPRGPVVDGPFANWRLLSGGQLIRNVGIDGELLTTDYVNDILSRRSYDDIVNSDTTNPRYHIEVLHGTVHVFVGGALIDLNTAAFDPVFFMHHAFIDYIFEQFRQRLRSRGVNPSTYPRAGAVGVHAPNAPTGLSITTQADGFSDNMATKATYEPVPTCSSRSTSCGNRFLVCQLSSGFCIPTTRSVTRSTSKTRRSVKDTSSTDTCEAPEAPTFDLPNQNDFCCRDGCDTSQWVMIPIKIVSVRPPNYNEYKSYPVTRNDVDYDDDIYSPNAYEDTSRYISDCYGNLKTYSRCHQASSAGQIFIYSTGINYSGYYKESVIVDQKLTVSVSIGFVAVRKPCTVEGKVTKALIRAHDSCGRMCQVTCRNPVTEVEEVCSGAVAVNEEKPYMFGDTLNEAIKSVVKYRPNTRIPKFRLDNTYFTFYCDYSETFPFADLPNTVVPSI